MSRYPTPGYDDPTPEGVTPVAKDYQNIDLASGALEYIRRMNAKQLSDFAQRAVEDNLSSRLILSLTAEEQEADMVRDRLGLSIRNSD